MSPPEADPPLAATQNESNDPRVLKGILKNAIAHTSVLSEAVDEHDKPPPLQTTSDGRSMVYDELSVDSSQTQKHIARRPQHDCDPCRERRIFCDEGKPVCSFCITNELACTYRRPDELLRKDHWEEDLDHGQTFDKIYHRVDAVLGLNSEMERKHQAMQSDLNKMMESLQHITDQQQHHRESLQWLRTNHHQTLSASRLLNHFEAHGEVVLTAEERFQLADLEEKLMKLAYSSRWSSIRSRLVSYITSLPTTARVAVRPKYGFVERTEGSQYQYLTGSDPCAWLPPSATALVNNRSHEVADPMEVRPPSPSSPTGRSLSRIGSQESFASGYTASKKRREMTGDWSREKPHFCFHESCAQTYSAGKAFETHMRGYHKPKPPSLPMSCNHDGSVKTFATWEESLAHMMHHQKHLSMSRAQYDKLLADQMFFIDHENMRIDATGNSLNPDFTMLNGVDGVPDGSGSAWEPFSIPNHYF